MKIFLKPYRSINVYTLRAALGSWILCVCIYIGNILLINRNSFKNELFARWSAPRINGAKTNSWPALLCYGKGNAPSLPLLHNTIYELDFNIANWNFFHTGQFISHKVLQSPSKHHIIVNLIFMEIIDVHFIVSRLHKEIYILHIPSLALSIGLKSTLYNFKN